MKGYEVIARVLQAQGIEFLTCFPLNQIIDAAAALQIRPVVARTERVAINIADGYSRMLDGQNIGVSAVQYGPGAENAFGAIAQAFGDSTPLVCLSGSLEAARLGIPPNFRVSENFKHITKWAETVTDVQTIPQMMRYAFALAGSGKPGPVLLEFPSDVMLSEFSGGAFYVTPPKRHLPSGDLNDIREVVDALIAAREPVIVAGQGVLYGKAWDELKELAELLQVPVMSTLNGKSAFPENHPLALGAANGLSRPDTVEYFLRKADFILGIGTSFTISKFIAAIPSGKTIAQITVDESDISKDYPTSYGVIGDAKSVLRGVIERVKTILGENGRRNQSKSALEVQAVKRSFLEKWMPRLTSNQEPIGPYRVIWELMQTLDRTRTVITHDSGCPRDQMVPFYEAIVPHGYIGWGKSTPLGSSLGLIMGAKLAKPDWLTVNLMGDAAFGMVGMDFETAVRSHIPILTVLMNNGVMGGYTKKQPIASELYGIHKLSGDYQKVAQALGGYAERVTKVEDLKPAIERAIGQTQSGIPALLEIITADDPVFPGA
jgi:thiamine pyrophosphate-dependent acetolactate synthase large subunit-like protein